MFPLLHPSILQHDHGAQCDAHMTGSNMASFLQVPTELPNFGFLGSICMFYSLLHCNPK